jgi:ATP-dependent DNA helicase RecQ
MQPIEVLKQHYGFERFRSRQLPVIERVLGGGHALVIMPTGMGKSLCFQIPAVIHAADKTASIDGVSRGLTLVISPLIALMKDQVDALVARGD